MKVFALSTFIAMFTIGSSAVASGLDTYVLKDSKVKPFSSITVDSAIQATVICADKNTVRLTSNKFLKGIAKTDKNGVLHIGFDIPPMAFIPPKGVYRAMITTTAPLDSVHVDYGADVLVTDCASNPDTFNITAKHNSGAVTDTQTKTININAYAESLVAIKGDGNNTVNANIDKGSKLAVCEINTLVAKATGHSTVLTEQVNSEMIDISSDSKTAKTTDPCGQLAQQIDTKKQKAKYNKPTNDGTEKSTH